MRKEWRVVSDVIIGIFCFISSGERFYLDYPEVTLFFNQASKKEEYSKLFKGFVWDESQVYHWSETMSFAWDRLLEFHVNWFYDSDGTTWTVIPDSRREEIKSLFTSEEQDLLKSLASEFLAKFRIRKG